MHEAQRSQMVWGRIDLDAQLPEDPPARAIWAVVERLDLSMLYGQIEARDEVAGAPAIDPKILLALWVYATSEGESVSSNLNEPLTCQNRTAPFRARGRWRRPPRAEARGSDPEVRRVGGLCGFLLTL